MLLFCYLLTKTAHKLLIYLFVGAAPNYGSAPPPPPQNSQMGNMPPTATYPQQTQGGWQQPTGYPQWQNPYGYNPYQQMANAYAAPPPPWVNN